MSDYHKYLKYKNKYLKLKNQISGSSNTVYDSFINEIIFVYNLVKAQYGNSLVLTGSSALFFLLIINQKFNLLNDLNPPNDIDFVYSIEQVNNPQTIGDYKLKSEYTAQTKSVSYLNNSGRKFDVTFIEPRSRTSKSLFTPTPTTPKSPASIQSTTINSINVILPQKLLLFYEINKEEDGIINDNLERKINALKLLINEIKNDSTRCGLYHLCESNSPRESIFGSPLGKGPMISSPIREGPMFSSPVREGPMFSSQIMGGPMFSSPVREGQMFSSPIMGGPMISSPVREGQMFSSPIIGGPMFSSPVKEGPLIQVREGPTIATPIKEGPLIPISQENILGSPSISGSLGASPIRERPLIQVREGNFIGSPIRERTITYLEVPNKKLKKLLEKSKK